jgi:predicted dehydrogenase
MQKGKAVYSEKPMIQKISEGLDEVKVQKQTKAVLQVGSQGISGIDYAKAKELYKAGDIGQINTVEANFNRQSALGAWQYTIPLDASPKTVDWETFQATTKNKHPYEDVRFFRWRNYRDYGTGVAGDLFVHLLTGIHYITDSKGPNKIYSIGDLTFWKDGRDVPDVMNAVLQYPSTPEHPAFQVALKVNFISGAGETGSTKITGTEGVMEMNYNGFTIHRSKMPKAPGIGSWDALETYPEEMQKQIREAYNKKWTKEDHDTPKLADIKYVAPEEDDAHYNHFFNFFEAIRSGKPVVEDAEFGFRAAAPCLACNDSYFQDKVIHWDPVNMKVV